MNKELQDLAFPLFIKLFLLQHKNNLSVAPGLMLDAHLSTKLTTAGIQCSAADWISLYERLINKEGIICRKKDCILIHILRCLLFSSAVYNKPQRCKTCVQPFMWKMSWLLYCHVQWNRLRD